MRQKLQTHAHTHIHPSNQRSQFFPLCRKVCYGFYYPSEINFEDGSVEIGALETDVQKCSPFPSCSSLFLFCACNVHHPVWLGEGERNSNCASPSLIGGYNNRTTCSTNFRRKAGGEIRLIGFKTHPGCLSLLSPSHHR